jgi:hypothetical protein
MTLVMSIYLNWELYIIMATSPTSMKPTSDTARTRAEKIGGVLLEDINPTPIATTKRTAATYVEGLPGADKYINGAAVLGLSYGLTKGIQYRFMPAPTRSVFNQVYGTLETEIVPGAKPGLFAVEKNIGSAIRNNPVRTGVAAVAVVTATSLYWRLSQDDSEITVARSDKPEDNGRLDIAAYQDVPGLKNKAQVVSLIFKASNPRGEPVLESTEVEQSGALWQGLYPGKTLIKTAQDAALKALEKHHEKDPVEIAKILLHTHKVLNSKGQTKDADTILQSLNDLAKLENSDVNKLITDHVKNFSDLNASADLKALRATLSEVQAVEVKKPKANGSDSPIPPAAGTSEPTEEQIERLRELEAKNKK